jgi:hypothetical protein
MKKKELEIPDELKDKIGDVLNVAKVDMDINGQIPWTILFNTFDNRCFHVQGFFKNEEEKEQDLKYVSMLMGFFRAKTYFLVCESWSLPMEKKDPDREIRLHFEKKSILMVVYASKKYKLIKSSFVKKIDGKFIFEPYIELTEASGRMTQLINFDKYDNYKNEGIRKKLLDDIPLPTLKDKEELVIKSMEDHSNLKITEAPSLSIGKCFYE